MELLPLLFLGVLMWLLLIRPQQQRVRRQQALLGSLEVGDTVVTAGGILGDIVRLDDDRVFVDVGSGVTLTFVRAAISQRLEPPQPEGDGADEGG